MAYCSKINTIRVFLFLQSSVNQNTESVAESEAGRNRSQKDQKNFFFFRFRFRFRRFRSSENNGRWTESEAELSANQKPHYQSLSNLKQKKKGGSRGKAGGGCGTVPRSLRHVLQGLQNTPRTHNLLLPWFRCRRLLRRMRIKINIKSSNLSSSPESAILNVYKWKWGLRWKRGLQFGFRLADPH